MKSGIPWEVAEVGRSGQRDPASLGHGDVSVAKGPDRRDDGGYRRLESPENDRSAGDRDDRAVPTAAPSAFRAVTPGAGATPAQQPGRVEKRVDTLRNDLAEIHLMLQEARPRSVIEALQREINRLGERADNCRRAGIDAAAVAAIRSRLPEIRDALRTLRPAESLLGMARVVQQLSHKIDIIAGAWDAAVLEQLEGAVAAMRSVVSHAASHEALAKLSEEVCALGAKLDHARSCADSRTLSTLETRIAMLAEQLQARDRNDPNVSDELKVLIERLIERIDRMELTSATCSPRPPALRTWSRNWSRNSTPAMPVSINSQRSKAHWRSCSSISDADRCRFSAKIRAPTRRGGALARCCRPQANGEADPGSARSRLRHAGTPRGSASHDRDGYAWQATALDGGPGSGMCGASLATRAAPDAPLPREEPATPPPQPATDPYPTDSLVPPIVRSESGPGAASDPNPDWLRERGIPRKPPSVAVHRPSSRLRAAPRRWQVEVFPRRTSLAQLKSGPTIGLQGNAASWAP